MYVNPSWNFKETVKNLKALKKEYKEHLTSFYYVREENEYIRKIKDLFYALNFDENKIDHLWEYLNDDLDPLSCCIFLGIGDWNEKNNQLNDFDL